MKRDLSAYLLSWKDSQNRKPILLRGARQESGITGSLKSLLLFLKMKKSPYGIQLSLHNFFVDEGKRVRGFPLYAISTALKELPRRA